MKIVAIDSSNREKAIKLTQEFVTEDCENRASVAEVLVVKAIDKKRIEHATGWLLKNGANRDKAVSALRPEFGHPGKQCNRGVVNSVVSRAFSSLNKKTSS